MSRIRSLTLSCLVLVSASVAAAQPPSPRATTMHVTTQARKLTPEDLKGMLAGKNRIFLLDVREPKELDDIGAVEGSVNIPLGQLESRLSEVPKDRTIVTICRVGGRAGRAAELLTKNGYRTAGATGLLHWKEKGYAVVYPKKSVK